MGLITGFKEFKRIIEPYRPINLRIQDYQEITVNQHDDALLKKQGARCMDCGVPFCLSITGCPLHNIIPEFNDLVYKDDYLSALKILLKTNNFPEFTGRVCPAPCEGACVLGSNNDAVAIKNIEQAIIDKAYTENWITAKVIKNRTKFKIAIIGSGPAGLACADELNQLGHNVTVFERDNRIGGLLMYGIPNMKLDKNIINKKVSLMQEEGIKFTTNTNIGTDITLNELKKNFDAILLSTGCTKARTLNITESINSGVYLAMEYLTNSTKALLNNTVQKINAKGKNVVVIGGGDTGTDCIATALRQGAKSIVNFELTDKPPLVRNANNPWPQWPHIYRIDYGHAEAQKLYGKDPRAYNITTKDFISSNGKLTAIKTVNVSFVNNKLTEIENSEKIWPVDLALIAIGFVSPEPMQNITLDACGNYKADYHDFSTNLDKIFTAGDCRRGQSLVVWAIQEGRLAANKINQFLLK